MKKMHFCPKCNLMLRMATVKHITRYPSRGGFGMFSYYNPISLTNVASSFSVLKCPKCGCEQPIAKPEKLKKQKSARSGVTFFNVLLGILLTLLVIAVVLVGGAFILDKTGHMPESVVDAIYPILPEAIQNIFH